MVCNWRRRICVWTGDPAIMGKVGGVSEKVAEARARKEQSKKAGAAASEKQKEDEYWDAHSNPKAKRDTKREEQERQREEAARKKAEVKRLAAEEEAAMAAAAKKKAAKPQAQKLTAAQLAAQRERDMAEQQQLAAQRALEGKRMVTEEEHAAALLVANKNREEGVVEARSVDAALEALTMDSPAGDRHPEKRAKAAYAAYLEEQLEVMKQVCCCTSHFCIVLLIRWHGCDCESFWVKEQPELMKQVRGRLGPLPPVLFHVRVRSRSRTHGLGACISLHHQLEIPHVKRLHDTIWHTYCW